MAWLFNPLVPAHPKVNGNEAKSSGAVRARLVSLGVDIVEFSMTALTPGTDQISTTSVLGIAAVTVSQDLYRRGMLSAVWDVSPGLASKALEGGQIQQILVRRSQSDGVLEAENPDVGDQELTKVLHAIHRLCGNSTGVDIGDKGGAGANAAGWCWIRWLSRGGAAC